MRRTYRALALTACVALVVSACGDGSGDGRSGDSGGVVATTTMLGSIASDIATCAGGSARTLMPVGADPHEYQPASSDVADMVHADLVVMNGLGLEVGMADSVRSAEADGASVLEVAEQVDPLPFAADEGGSGAGSEKGSAESLDPHFWLDAARGAAAAAVIGDRWAEETGDDTFRRCGQEVEADLRAVDEQVRAILEPIPAQHRVLVTDHEALGYFASAYGFSVVGTVIPGGSTLAEPSSADLAELVTDIDSTGAPAIFTNSTSSPDLATAVAKEVGRDVAVVELYVGSLGEEGSGADTYAGMLRTNAERIAAALG